MSLEPKVVRDPKTGIVAVSLGHHYAHGTPADLVRFAAALIAAAYEAEKGEHDAGPLPRSQWRVRDIANG